MSPEEQFLAALKAAFAVSATNDDQPDDPARAEGAVIEAPTADINALVRALIFTRRYTSQTLGDGGVARTIVYDDQRRHVTFIHTDPPQGDPT